MGRIGRSWADFMNKPHYPNKCSCGDCTTVRIRRRQLFSASDIVTTTTKPRLASLEKRLGTQASLQASSTQIRSDEKLDDHSEFDVIQEKGIDSTSTTSTSKPQSPPSRLPIGKLRSNKKLQSLRKRKALKKKKKQKKKLISTP